MILHCTRNIQDETCESKTKFGTFLQFLQTN